MKTTQVLNFTLVVGLVGTFATACGRSRSPSYLQFMARNPGYYRGLAESCDQLLSAWTNQTSETWVLRGDDKSLPPLILELNPSKVTLRSEFVWIMVGVTRPGFGITWAKNDYGDEDIRWELSSHADGMKTIVFSTNKPPWRRTSQGG